MSNRHMIGRSMAIVMCLLAPFFSYAQAYVTLGETISSAPAISDSILAVVNDGVENYFMIEAEHMPATVYYYPDSAFGPIPELISFVDDDTLPALMVSENCRMGWKWELTMTGEAEQSYFTFAAHENNAIAAILPTVCHPYAGTLLDTAVCDEYVWGDTTITDSGTYTRRFTAIGGCDSVLTQRVTVNMSSDFVMVPVTAYDTYTWLDGITYTKSVVGPIYDELKSVAGCDSVLTLNLTIRHLIADTLRASVCPDQLPYHWNGKDYSESGIYTTDTIEGEALNSVYMDTLHAMNLTILPVTTGDTTASACETFTWYGVTYTESAEPKHTFTNYQGCDSVVTLHLTIHHAATGDTTAAACESFTWYGVTYTESAEPKHTLTSSLGCDSVVTLRLTINYPSSSEETHKAYDSYEWHGRTYYTSGDYTYRTTNVAGCDSIITLHLTVKPTPVYTYDTAYFCPGINTEHDEPLNDTQAIRYLPYVYQAPAAWYKEGMIVEELPHGMTLDLYRAEENLRSYYVGNLEPVEQIAWSYRAHKTASYEPINAGQEPQWLGTGDLMLNVYFLCGHEYRDLLVIGSTEDIDNTNVTEQPETRKVLKNGQLYIIRGNAKYTIFGTRIE